MNGRFGPSLPGAEQAKLLMPRFLRGPLRARKVLNAARCANGSFEVASFSNHTELEFGLTLDMGLSPKGHFSKQGA